jgi:hypothetical protein
LLQRVEENAKWLGITLSSTKLADAFDQLLTGAAEEHGAPVVVLVDE